MSTYARIVALIFAAVALLCVGYRHGMKVKQGEWDADNLIKAEQRAAEVAQSQADLQAKNDQIHKQAQEHADEVRTINDRLAVALERLRKRPERMPEPARSACSGATGRELAGVDAAFLERYAARAARQESALNACYAWMDTVTASQ